MTGRNVTGRGLKGTTKLLLVGVAAATLAVYVWSFALQTTKDRPDQLDTAPVVAAASAACTRLRANLAGMPALAPDAPAAVRLARLAAQDRAVSELVTAVRAVGRPDLDHDVPAAQWLADWESLARARSQYAAAGGTGPYVPVQAAGHPLTDRMDRIGVPACTVPAALSTAP